MIASGGFGPSIFFVASLCAAAGCAGMVEPMTEDLSSAPDVVDAAVRPPDIATPDLSPDDFRLPLPPIDFGPLVDLSLPDLGRVSRPDMALPSTCKMEKPLAFANGAASASGDTRLSAATEQGTCGGNGRELVFSIVVNAPSVLQATVTADGVQTPGFVPIVYLRDVCEDETSAHELDCVRSSAGKATIAARLSAGTYHVIVDGQDGTKGIFTLAATLQPAPAAPANDTCMAPAALAFDMTGHASVTGDLGGAANDGASGCGGTKSGDVVYSFTTKAATNFAAMVLADPMTPRLSPVLELRRACADPTLAIVCDQPEALGGAAMINVPALAAGTYYLWVDGGDAAPGKFALDAYIGTAPMNDACPAAAALSPMNGMADVPVSTMLARDDSSSFACSGQAPDVVYTLPIAQPSSITAWVTPMTPGWRPIIYLRPQSLCTNAGVIAELGCGGGLNFGAPQIVVPNAMPGMMAPGNYSLWVDGYRGTWGKGTLSVRLGSPITPAANENCAKAQVLTPDPMTGIATASVDTRASLLDATGSCGGAAAPDVAYSLMLAAQKKVTVTVKADPSTPQWRPVLYARTTCDNANTQLACDNRYGDTATLSFPRLNVGNYYFWVDGLNTTRGLGTITVVTEAPLLAPVNNGCGKPAAIMANTPVTGDTIPSTNLFGARISAFCDPNNYGRYAGNDVTYVYTPVASGTVTFSLTPSSTWDAALLVTPAMCVVDGSACAAVSDVPGAGSEEEVQVAVQAGTPYFVVVDGAAANQAGTFSLLVK